MMPAPYSLTPLLLGAVFLSGHPHSADVNPFHAPMTIGIGTHVRSTLPSSVRADTTARHDSSDVIAGIETARRDTLRPISHWKSTGWKGRVVVGEYFSSLFDPTQIFEETAFSGLRARYPSTAFISLAYFDGLDLPFVGSAENPGKEFLRYLNPTQRWRDQKGETVMVGNDFRHNINGPEAYVRIRNEDAQGNLWWSAQYRYNIMVWQIDSLLQTMPAARLQVQASPKGGTLVAHVTVDSLSAERTDVYVRLLLVEDSVRVTFVPPKFSTTARMVVRSTAHTDNCSWGIPLHTPRGQGTATYTFDVARTQQLLLDAQKLGRAALPADVAPIRELLNFLPINADDQLKAILPMIRSDRGNWTINPKRLHIVAMVHDAKTGEILQAQMIPVTSGPNGEQLTL